MGRQPAERSYYNYCDHARDHSAPNNVLYPSDRRFTAKPLLLSLQSLGVPLFSLGILFFLSSHLEVPFCCFAAFMHSSIRRLMGFGVRRVRLALAPSQLVQGIP